MAGRSGIFGQLGVATEETFGTYKAPSRFYPFISESLALDINYLKTTGIRAGRLVQSKTLHRATTRTVGGDFQINFFDQGMGILLNQLHGETITPTKIGSGTAYKQIHKIGTTDPFAKSLTVQVGRPDVGGTVRAFSYLGCKITDLKFSVDAQGESMLTVSIDGTDEKTGESLGSATYDTDTLPFTFQQCVAKLGGSELAQVRNIEIAVSVPYNTERYNFGNEGTKDQPIINDQISLTANATLEFASLADHERYTKEEEAELIFTGTGAVASEANKFTTKWSAPIAKQVTSSPAVGGPDIITQDITFELLDDGTNPPLSVELISTDTTI